MRTMNMVSDEHDGLRHAARRRLQHDLDKARDLLDALHEVVVNLLAEDDLAPLLDDCLFQPKVTYRERLLELAVGVHEAGFGDEVWGDQ